MSLLHIKHFGLKHILAVLPKHLQHLGDLLHPLLKLLRVFDCYFNFHFFRFLFGFHRHQLEYVFPTKRLVPLVHFLHASPLQRVKLRFRCKVPLIENHKSDVGSHKVPRLPFWLLASEEREARVFSEHIGRSVHRGTHCAVVLFLRQLLSSFLKVFKEEVFESAISRQWDGVGEVKLNL